MAKLDLSQPVYALSISPYIFPPGGLYYLSRKADVKLYDEQSSGLDELKGKAVVIPKQSLEKPLRNEDGIFQLESSASVYSLRETYSVDGYSLMNMY